VRAVANTTKEGQKDLRDCCSRQETTTVRERCRPVWAGFGAQEKKRLVTASKATITLGKPYARHANRCVFQPLRPLHPSNPSFQTPLSPFSIRRGWPQRPISKAKSEQYCKFHCRQQCSRFRRCELRFPRCSALAKCYGCGDDSGRCGLLPCICACVRREGAIPTLRG